MKRASRATASVSNSRAEGWLLHLVAEKLQPTVCLNSLRLWAGRMCGLLLYPRFHESTLQLASFEETTSVELEWNVCNASVQTQTQTQWTPSAEERVSGLSRPPHESRSDSLTSGSLIQIIIIIYCEFYTLWFTEKRGAERRNGNVMSGHSTFIQFHTKLTKDDLTQTYDKLTNLKQRMNTKLAVNKSHLKSSSGYF